MTKGDVELAVAASGPGERTKQFFSVGGMTCAACSGTIERALALTRGVYSAKVSLLTERCEVVYDPRILTPGALVSEIEDVGFEAAVSISSGVKDRVSLVCGETMDATKRAIITKAAMEHVGVLAVTIAPRVIAPFHDVVEVEFDAKQHDLSGPGAAKPIVWQGPPPNTATTLSPSSSNSSAASPHSGSSASPTSSPSVAPPEALGRFSIRALVHTLKSAHGLVLVSVRNDGDLEARKDEMAHRRAAELAQWKSAFMHSMLFTVPIALICWIGPLIPVMRESLMTPIHRSLTREALVTWLLVTPVQFGFGMRFYRGSWNALKHRSANMDVLVALGSSASYFYSLIICIMCLSNDHYQGNVFFETSALLISIVLLGRYVEGMAKGRTSEALSVLMGLAASTATLLTLDPLTGEVTSEEEIDVNLVQAEDVLMVHRGGKVPVDGVMVSSLATAVDEALLTGESMPVTKNAGDTLIGGTINLEQPMRMRATGVGQDTVLSKIVNLVNDAQSSKAPIQAYADYIGSIFVPCVVALAVFVFLLWYTLCLTGVVPDTWRGPHQSSFLFSFLFSISVLLISCPCSLGLATPTAVMVGTGVGASLGVLFKGGEPLEITGKATIVVFDKTGTISEGRPTVSEQHTWIDRADLGLDERAWWMVVGSLAHQSEHLMSRAIATHAQARQRGLAPSAPTSAPVLGVAASSNVLEAVHDFDAQSGGGCRGTVRGHRVVLGNARWLGAHGVVLSPDASKRMERVQMRGTVTVLVAIDGKLSGIVALADAVKPEARAAVRALQARGIEVFMLSGDNATVCHAVGEMVAIPRENVISHVTPAEKAEVVRRIQAGDFRPEQRPGYQPSSTSQQLQTRARAPSADADLESGVDLLGSSSDSSLGHSASSWLGSCFGLLRGSSSGASTPAAPVVVMVGDGLNDGPSLSVADVGVSMGSGTDFALETAAVVLMKNDLGDVVTAIDLSQATLHRIRRNFLWACIYNLLAIPVAAGVLFPLVHSGLPPILAAACMGLSSTSVIASSLMLKRYRKPLLADADADADDQASRPSIAGRLFGSKSKRKGGYTFSSLPTAGDDGEVADFSLGDLSDADSDDEALHSDSFDRPRALSQTDEEGTDLPAGSASSPLALGPSTASSSSSSSTGVSVALPSRSQPLLGVHSPLSPSPDTSPLSNYQAPSIAIVKTATELQAELV